MFERASLQGAGGSGAGKTALVARFLHRADRQAAAARCIRDDGLRRPKTSARKKGTSN